MLDRFAGTTCVVVDGDVWSLCFGVVIMARKSRGFVYAEKRGSGVKLTAPADFEKICELVPFDDWPPFAKNVMDKSPLPSEGQERLF